MAKKKYFPKNNIWDKFCTDAALLIHAGEDRRTLSRLLGCTTNQLTKWITGICQPDQTRINDLVVRLNTYKISKSRKVV